MKDEEWMKGFMPREEKDKIFNEYRKAGKELKELLGKNIDKTLENMLAHQKIQKWVEWIKDKEFGVCIKRKKRK